MNTKRNLFKLFTILGASMMLFSCNTPSVNSSESFESSISSSESSESSSTLPLVSLDEDATLISSMRFKNDVYKVNSGKSISISPNVLPVNATYQQFYWTSSDPSIATVNQRGYVHGEQAGETIITAYALDGSGEFAETTVMCIDAEVTSINFQITSKNCSVGEEFIISASVNPVAASIKTCFWTSSDESVAIVTQEGKVTCLKEGISYVRATSRANDNVYAECKVRVTKIDLLNFTLSKRNLYLHIGERATIEGRFYPSNASNKNIVFVTTNDHVAIVNQNGVVTAKGIGDCYIYGASSENGKSAYCKVEVLENDEMLKTSMNYTYSDYNLNNIMKLSSTPSDGDVKGLVIPVWFTDSNKFIVNEKKESVRRDIDKSFFGESEEVGWRTVRTYYDEESRGRFALTGLTTKWFECGMSYENFMTSNEATVQLTSVATEWVKKTYSDENWKEYDMNCDGYFDQFVLVYAAPDYNALRNWNASNLWAYCSWTQVAPNYDSPVVNNFMWASYDFMYGRNIARDRTGTDFGSGRTIITHIDTHTFIHEYGHLLGLTDYYDYSGQYSPAAGFSMQDHNVGGHDPYSLMALGWVDPYIPKNDAVITINPFTESGDIILLTEQFNKDDSPFDEYVLIELFTPTGTNHRDADPNTSEYGFNANFSGIRIWHIDARLVVGNSRNITTSRTFTSNPLIDSGNVYHAISNTYFEKGESPGNASILGESFGDYNLLQLIRKDTNKGHRCADYFTEADVFKTGDKFSLTKYQNQFKNTGTLNNGDELPWTVTFDKVTSEKAIVTLIKDY